MAGVKNEILTRVFEKQVALGNTRKGFKEVASDLLAHSVGKNNEYINAAVAGTYLSKSTLLRVLECEENYRPQAETIERILRYCNAEVTFNETVIKPSYQNKPKGKK